MRRAHWLKGNKGTPLPHAAVWVDTETDQRQTAPGVLEHTLRFGWACYQRTRPDGAWTSPEWFRFDSREGLWAWLETKARPRVRLYVYAHNWAFDALVLGMFDQLPARGWKLTRAIIESPPVIVSWRRDRSTVECLDTLNWWPMPLRDLGAHVGLPKLRPPGRGSSPSRWDAYCRRDVEVIRRATHEWWQLLRKHELGGYAKTIAAQAMRAFRHRFLAHRVLIDENIGALLTAREGLFGGRTEAYRIGRVRGPISCYDVNSMYPDVMTTNEVPTVLRLFARAPTRAEWSRWIASWACVARVKLVTDEPVYPYRLHGRLVFPVGAFETTLTTPDLRQAAERGHLRSVSAIALYESAPLFAPYIEALYKLRSEAIAARDPVNSWLLKLLLNSLFGKFAQRGQVWSEIGPGEPGAVRTWRDVDYDTGQTDDYAEFGGVIQRRSWEQESHDSHPAITAHVTAHARRRLWQLMERAGRDEVLYVDTDSLWVTSEGARRLDRLVHPTALGALKLVETVEWLLIHGVKDYATPARVVCKGVRSSAVWTTPTTAVQEQWSGIRAMVELGRLDAPRTKTRVLRLLRRYEKGTVGRDGRVSPIRLAEW